MRTTALLLALIVGACSSSQGTKRVDPGDDDAIMGTGLESADIEAISELAKSLLKSPALTNTKGDAPTVAIHPVQNDTRFDFDSELLVRRIRQELVENAAGRVRFVSRGDLDEAMVDRERAEKRAGERTHGKLDKAKTGVDYYLTGTASSLSKVGGGIESDALYIDFRLVDAENGELVWEKGYKTKKVGKAGVVYR